MNIQEIRQQYPQYSDISDNDLAQKLHQKYYNDVPFEEFSSKIGLKASTQKPEYGFAQALSGEAPPGVDPGYPISAMGGIPAPGINERTQNVVGALPAIGATVASIAAPEIAVPAWAARLFGLRTAIANAPKIAAAMGGGAVGGGAREALRQPPTLSDLVTGNPQEAPTLNSILSEAFKSGGEMGAAELGGGYVAKGIGKVLAPAANKLTQEAKNLIDFARGQKIPSVPADFVRSMPAKVIQGGFDAFLPSRMVNDAYRKSAVVRFNQLMTELPNQKVGEVVGNTKITQDVLGSLDEILSGSGNVKGLEQTAREGRKAFLDSIGQDTAVGASNTMNTLKQVRSNAVDANLQELVRTKLQQFGRGKNVTAESLDQLMNQIGSTKVTVKADQKYLTNLREAIKEDFKTAGADMSQLSDANKQFAEMFGALKGQAAKKLKSDLAKGIEPTGLTVKLFRPESEGLLTSLKSRLPEKTWDSLRAQNLSNMIKNSMTESKELPGMGIIDGAKLEKIMDANMDVLKKHYDEGTLTAMKNLATLSKNMKGSLNMLEKGDSSVFDTFSKGVNVGAAGAAIYNPYLMVPAAGGSMLLASSMMNPKGWMKQWLTTGFEGTALKEGLKLGGRSVFQDSGLFSSSDQ